MLRALFNSDSLACRALAGVLICVLAGCSAGPNEVASVPRPAQRSAASATHVSSSKAPSQTFDQGDFTSRTQIAGVRAPASDTVEAIQLEKIVEKEAMLMLEVSIMPEDIQKEEKHRRLYDLIYDYENFISSHPESELGLILYGKLLRRLGLNKKANNMFARVNKLNPNIAVVKQQIGNFLAEEGMFELALPYFLAAIELEPQTARYHYQLGELLYTYYEAYLSKEVYTRETLDEQMLGAFRRAAELDTQERTYRFRYAEAFYDVVKPNWSEARRQWETLLASAQSEREADIVRLQLARVYMFDGQPSQARALLEKVNQPALEQTRQQLLAELQ